MPLDHYDFNTPAYYYFPTSCPGGVTVRACIQQQLLRLRSQHVSGVRFQFAFCGGAGSTPLVGCGQYSPPFVLNQTWMNNVSAFFTDIKQSGISNVIITPAHAGFGGDWLTSGPPAASPSGYPCARTPSTVYYWAANPFATTASGDGKNLTYPIGQNDNNAFNCAPKNPHFIGWQNMYIIIDRMIAAAASANLNITELDYEQELVLHNFPAELRFMIDTAQADTGYGDKSYPLPPPAGTQVYSDTYLALRYNRSTHGYDPGKLNYSAGIEHPNVVGVNCTSAYTDYARLIEVDEVIAGIAGGKIGTPMLPPEGAPYGLYCTGSITPQMAAGPMFQVPVGHSSPS